MLCELVLVEIYMQPRNPAVLREPLTAAAAADFCDALKVNPAWQWVNYEPRVATKLWRWARTTTNSSPCSLNMRAAPPSATSRSAASSGNIHNSGRPPRARKDGIASM